FSRLVAGTPELAAVLSERGSDPRRRSAVARELLDGKASAATISLVELAVEVGLGGRRVDASLDHLVNLVAARRDREVAYVTVAAPLTEEQESRLAETVGRLRGTSISLQVQIDPSVIGGMSV